MDDAFQQNWIATGGRKPACVTGPANGPPLQTMGSRIEETPQLLKHVWAFLESLDDSAELRGGNLK